jgi:hypothetical protein
MHTNVLYHFSHQRETIIEEFEDMGYCGICWSLGYGSENLFFFLVTIAYYLV